MVQIRCFKKKLETMNKKQKRQPPIKISVWLAIIAIVMIFLLIIWLSVVDMPS